MTELTKQLNLDVCCSAVFGIEDLNNIFINIDIKYKNGEIVEVEDEFDLVHLSYSTVIISYCKHKYFKFYSWNEDDDFIETVEWIIEKLTLKASS